MKKIFTKILTLCLACMLMMMAVPVKSYAATKTYPLTSFDIAKYGDSQNTYRNDGGTISKSKGPLVLQAIRYGNGHIDNDGIFLDGQALLPSSFIKSVDVLEWDDDYNGTKWKDTITLKTPYTKELSNGSHTIKVVCWGAQRPIVDTITFNVVD